MTANLARRHAHHFAELQVDLVVGGVREAESQRRGHPAVAFDDVRIVPEGNFAAVDRGVEERLAGQRRDRPRLHDEQPVFAIDYPLGVLRDAVVILELEHPLADVAQAGVGQGRLAAGFLVQGLANDAAPGAEAHGAALVGDAGQRDREVVTAELEVVGIELAADQALAEPEDRVDDEMLPVQRPRWVPGEGDAGGRGLDHLLHDHADANAGHAQSSLHAVGERALGKAGCPAAADRRRQLSHAAPAEKGRELPREAVAGRVFVDAAGADGQQGVGQLHDVQPGPQFFFHRRGQWMHEEQLLDLFRERAEPVEVALRAKVVRQAVRVDEQVEGLRRDAEPGRHRDAGAGHSRHVHRLAAAPPRESRDGRVARQQESFRHFRNSRTGTAHR